MKRIGYYSCLLLIGMWSFLALPHPVLAVTNTNSDSNAGQVKLQTADGVMFLSTSVNSNGQSVINKTETISTNFSQPLSFGIENIQKPIGFASDLGSYLNSLLSIVMVVSLLLVFFHFISAGFQWITSGGDKSKTEEARNKIVNAFVGILIVSASFATTGYVGWILGFDSINEAIASISQINPS